MAYAPFADEATAREMSVEWHVDYQTMCRIIRNTGMRPARRNFASKYYDREQQAQLARDVAKYHLAPRYLDLEPESAGGDPETRNVSSQTQLRERCRVAEGRVKRLMEMVEADQTEIIALRAERTALHEDNDALRVQLHALMSQDDALLRLRLLPPCEQLLMFTEAEYGAFQASLTDDRNAVTILRGTLLVLGAALDASVRQNDARLLAGADVMHVARALQTLVDVGRKADARLDAYDCEAQAILAKDADTRTPEEVRP